jgi:hypothetical protein
MKKRIKVRQIIKGGKVTLKADSYKELMTMAKMKRLFKKLGEKL